MAGAERWGGRGGVRAGVCLVVLFFSVEPPSLSPFKNINIGPSDELHEVEEELIKKKESVSSPNDDDGDSGR